MSDEEFKKIIYDLHVENKEQIQKLREDQTNNHLTLLSQITDMKVKLGKAEVRIGVGAALIATIISLTPFIFQIFR